MGKKLGRPTFVTIHTNDLSAKNHKGEPFTWDNQKEKIQWVTNDDYRKNNASVLNEHFTSGEEL